MSSPKPGVFLNAWRKTEEGVDGGPLPRLGSTEPNSDSVGVGVGTYELRAFFRLSRYPDFCRVSIPGGVGEPPAVAPVLPTDPKLPRLM